MLTRNGMCDFNPKAAYRIYNSDEIAALGIGGDSADSILVPVGKGNNFLERIEIRKTRSEISTTSTKPELFPPMVIAGHGDKIDK